MPTAQQIKRLWSQVWLTYILSDPAPDHLPRLNFVQRHLIHRADYDSRQPDFLNAPFFKYTLSGTGALHINGTTTHLPAGHGFLFTADQPEECWFEHPAETSETWEWLHISFLGAEDLIGEIIERCGHVFELAGDHPLLAPFWNFRQKNAEEHTVALPLQDAALVATEFLTGLMQYNRTDSPASWSQALVRKAMERIQIRLNERPQIREIAAAMRVTPEHLSRVFKAETGMTPMQFYQREAVRSAKYLLTNPTLSVKEVAARMSFKSASHFVSFFRHHVGTSPAAYRTQRYLNPSLPQ